MVFRSRFTTLLQNFNSSLNTETFARGPIFLKITKTLKMCDSTQINRVNRERKPQFILFYSDIDQRRARFNSQLGFKVSFSKFEKICPRFRFSTFLSSNFSRNLLSFLDFMSNTEMILVPERGGTGTRLAL